MDVPTIARKDWLSQTPIDQVNNYHPTISLTPEALARIKPGVDTSKVVIPIFGLTGAGKSAFVESLEHIFKDLPIHLFSRQANGRVGRTFTRGYHIVSLNQYIDVIDVEGWANYDAEQVKKDYGQEIQQQSLLKQIFTKKVAKDSKIQFHCPIFVVNIRNLDQDGRRYAEIIEVYKSWLGGIAPPVIATCEDTIDRTEAELAQLCKDFLSATGASKVFPVTNYTHDSDTNMPIEEKDKRNKKLAAALVYALMMSDRILSNDRVIALAANKK